ncbi:MAG: hypothetical protein SH847_07745 [Roseiflexaceae bacterium]|nr:hypothetical protein [Roseiflexaceae bacterium]
MFNSDWSGCIVWSNRTLLCNRCTCRDWRCYNDARAACGCGFHTNCQSTSAISDFNRYTTTSLTPSPTSTATATPEPTYTPTITPLPTATLKPAQVKQTAVQATVDAKQAAVKATAEAKQAATATIVALDTEYPEVDIRDLVKRPQRYKGQKFQVTGKVFTIREQVDDGLFGTGETITQIQIWVTTPDGSKEAVVVLFNGTLEKVFEESTIIVYGVGEGTYEGVNGFGATITQPKVKAAFVRF